MKRKKIIIAGLVIFSSILIYLITFTDQSYDRWYMRLKNKGYLDKRGDLSEITTSKDVMVALTFGQSNAANSGEHRYTPHHTILNYAENKLYVANDPLVGTGGKGGSVWGILGDMLIDSGKYKKVVVIPIAMGSTSVSCWADSACHFKLVSTLQELKKNHIKLTHIFWHQGETDLGTSQQHYKEQLTKILKTLRFYEQNAPFYCSIASYNPGLPNLPVSSAQNEFIKENENVLRGPNTDLIIAKEDRWQKVHFTETGMNKYAAAWYVAIQNSAE